MQKKILVLGGGMVGSVMAADLSSNKDSYNYDVTVMDINVERISKLIKTNNLKNITTLKKDLNDLESENSFVNELQHYDIIVGAVPGFMGYKTVKAVLQKGKPIIDISFFPEDYSPLNQIAIENNTYGVFDIGVAPGVANLLLGYYNQIMKITDFQCLVGGLPYQRKLPFEYKAPFSPIDVLEEYTRPARLKVNNEIIIKDALSEPELINFEKVGTLEAFNTDGLRSIITSFPNIPNLKEKTMRFPGHIDLIKNLKMIGLLDETEIEIISNNQKVSIKPIELTSKLLIDSWKLEDKDDEFTVMQIKIKGENLSNKKIETVQYDLFDRKDFTTGYSSMARTTGFTATALVNYALENAGKIPIGFYPPELISNKEICDYIFNYLKSRNVNYSINII